MAHQARHQELRDVIIWILLLLAEKKEFADKIISQTKTNRWYLSRVFIWIQLKFSSPNVMRSTNMIQTHVEKNMSLIFICSSHIDSKSIFVGLPFNDHCCDISITSKILRQHAFINLIKLNSWNRICLGFVGECVRECRIHSVQWYRRRSFHLYAFFIVNCLRSRYIHAAQLYCDRPAMPSTMFIYAF